MTDEELKKKNAMLEERLEAAEKKLEDLGRVDEVDYVTMSKEDFKRELQRQIARRNIIEALLSDALTAVIHHTKAGAGLSPKALSP